LFTNSIFNTAIYRYCLLPSLVLFCTLLCSSLCAALLELREASNSR
jgi:hypothetical protein